jgi:hypothetical protein
MSCTPNHRESTEKYSEKDVVKEKKLNSIPKFVSKTLETMDQKQKIYFSGVHETSNIRCILKKTNTASFRIISVHSLEIIDSQIGDMMEAFFTLVPREKGIRLTSKKRDTSEAFESLRQSGRVNNSRGNSRTPMSESPNKPPYITVGHYYQRAAIGTADSMKNITSETHEGITRLFHVIERFSLQHIPFDEVMFFWAATKMGHWKSFPTANDNGERTDVFASMSSGLRIFLPVHNYMEFFTPPPRLLRGANRK